MGKLGGNRLEKRPFQEPNGRAWGREKNCFLGGGSKIEEKTNTLIEGGGEGIKVAENKKRQFGGRKKLRFSGLESLKAKKQPWGGKKGKFLGNRIFSQSHCVQEETKRPKEERGVDKAREPAKRWGFHGNLATEGRKLLVSQWVGGVTRKKMARPGKR